MNNLVAIINNIFNKDCILKIHAKKDSKNENK